MTQSGRRKASVDGLFQTKKEVHWHLDQTNADITAFRNDVADWYKGNLSNPNAIILVKKFNDFFTRWQTFYNDAKSSWHAYGGWVEQSENWRRRLIGWRQTFIANGMKPTTPNPELPPKERPWINSMLIAAGGGLLGAYLTDKLVRR